jgi:hypothetical protein
MRICKLGISLLLMININISAQLPKDLMSIPVLIEHIKRGTGFFIQDSTNFYLVTAKHVVFNPKSGKLYSNEMKLTCYEKDPIKGDKIEFNIDLIAADSLGLIIKQPKDDVLIIRMGRVNNLESGKSIINYYSAIQKLTKSTNINTFPIEYFTKYEDVNVGDEIYLFGYPTSLSLKDLHQFDYTRPLLRKGIIAGKYEPKKTLILDCPSYPGNSGGPILAVNNKISRIEYNLIGLVVEFIPYEKIKAPQNIADTTNSGYSVAVSSSKILELLNKH